jgi:hypothetical protein
MSSPVSKAKQPSIHAFFSGASKKKAAAGAGKEEKAKQDQLQLICLLDVLSSPVIPSIAD